MNYIIATIKPWDIANFKNLDLEGNWYLVWEKDNLVSMLNSFPPSSVRYIFFTHWSWKIPPEIYENYECVVFHPADLPDGRGSSVIQHRILSGIYHTKISALKVDKGFDTGDIYLKRDFCMNGGGEEIYMRLSDIIFGMIMYIVENEPTPIPQVGEGTVFKHRIPEQSGIDCLMDLKQLHDFIRMLDAETYPLAFFELGNLRFEFSRPCLKTDHLMADVRIIKR